MMSRLTPRVAVIVVVIVAIFAAGVTAGWLWFTADPPPSLASSGPAKKAPVNYQEYADARGVGLQVESVDESTLEVGLAGRVTSSECAPGNVLQSGSRLASIDGRPLLALATSSPLWRELREGDTGDDVTALQKELARLGYSMTSDGVVGPRTLTAFAQLMERAGDRSFDSENVDVARIVWLPSESVTIGSCDAQTGTRLEAGGALASVAARITQVSVIDPVPEVLDVERTLTVDSVTVPLVAGAVTDRSALDQLAATPTFALRREGSVRHAENDGVGAASISGTVAFSKPLVVGVVPPSAVRLITGGAGCVATEEGPVPVTIVGSQLGQTFVLFGDDQKPASVLLSRPERSACA